MNEQLMRLTAVIPAKDMPDVFTVLEEFVLSLKAETIGVMSDKELPEND